MKVALAQVNTTVGDISGNTGLILDKIGEASAQGADLIVFPELTVFGYPPKDLLLRKDIVAANVESLTQIAAACKNITAIVGFVEPDATGDGTGVFNSAAVCHDGQIVSTYAKRLLPTYDVFDESRYFNEGEGVKTVRLSLDGCTRTLGITICEDLWHDQQFGGRHVYCANPVAETVKAGADLVVNISGSPFRAGIQDTRETLFAAQVRAHGVPLIYTNLVGGNDELVFDGASLVIDKDGQVIARASAFQEELLIADFGSDPTNSLTPYPERTRSTRDALVLGLRDYVRKCGFQDVVIGLSGGIDSAVTAAIAVDAIGENHVFGVAMPSRFSSAHSVDDARLLADNLGISIRTIPIEHVHRAMEEAVAESFAGTSAGVAEENIQARIRGNLLMALSNKFGWLLLTTGNKSELAVGYCTLYGDMSGGLAVLSDVPKTVVYELANHINQSAGCERIPQNTINKAPSAELREDQTDQDALPPYDVLDAILEEYVEKDLPVEEITRQGFDLDVVENVARMVERSEYKRKQAPIGLKVTSRAFGSGRRMPIAARIRM